MPSYSRFAQSVRVQIGISTFHSHAPVAGLDHTLFSTLQSITDCGYDDDVPRSRRGIQ